MWDRPKPVMSKDDWGSLSADGAPPGVYVPNMSDEDRARWKVRLLGHKTGFPQLEIRKDSTVIILSLRGYKYKYYDTRQTPEKIAEAKANKYYPDPDAPKGWPTVHIATAGPMQLSLEELDEFKLALEEGMQYLRDLVQKSDPQG